MNENEYLELVNQLKKKFDENEMKVNIFIKQNIKLKKHIMTFYGIARMLDSLDYVEANEREFIYSHMMSYISDVIDKEVLSCPSYHLSNATTDDITSDLVEVDI